MTLLRLQGFCKRLALGRLKICLGRAFGVGLSLMDDVPFGVDTFVSY